MEKKSETYTKELLVQDDPAHWAVYHLVIQPTSVGLELTWGLVLFLELEDIHLSHYRDSSLQTRGIGALGPITDQFVVPS